MKFKLDFKTTLPHVAMTTAYDVDKDRDTSVDGSRDADMDTSRDVGVGVAVNNS